MNRRSPPWNAIEAFITAARVGSFKESASSLGLSAPAFSRRIQALEHHVGVKLFDRSGPVLSLTAAGERYRVQLEPGYQAIREATESIAPNPEHRALRVGVSQSLAVSWLVRKLGHFQQLEKEIHVCLQTPWGGEDLLGGAADVAILYGDGHWDGLVSEQLLPLEAFVVSAPRLADGRRSPRCVEDLADHVLLEVVRPADQWEQWLADAGRGATMIGERVRFDSVIVQYEAAAAGLGVALGIRPLVDPFLADGRLEMAFDLRFPLRGGYYIAALPSVRRHASVQRFWGWLVNEARAQTAGLPLPCPARVPVDARLKPALRAVN